MSSESGLTDRDRAVLEASGVEAAPEADDDTDERIAELEAKVDLVLDELEAERQKRRELVSIVNELQRETRGDASLVGNTTLQKYASMTEDDREELLSTSERRAVDVHLHWDELAWNAQGRRLVDTAARANAKNQPSKLKYRLEKHFDRSIQWTEIYRLMKALARLSGGDAETDTAGREHITGGSYEYHHRATPDGKETKRILMEATE